MMGTETLTDRELDALVAEKVFGGPQHNVQWYWWKSSTPSLDIDPPLYAGPHFSTDIAAAWQVADVLRTMWREFHLDIFHSVHPEIWENSDLWICSNRSAYDRTHCESIEGKAATAPLAICRAALNAID